MAEATATTHPVAYTIAATCKAAGLGRTKIYQLIKSGKLVARKCGRRTLILAADLDDFLRHLPSQPGSPNSESR